MARISFDNNFSFEDIVSIRELSPGQPVWLLEGEQDSTIVIKCESKGDKTSSSLSNVFEVMSIVSPGTRKTKLLVNSELAALKKWITMLQLAGDGLDEAEARIILAIKSSLDHPQRSFLKMETMQLITLQHGNDRALKKIRKVLNGPRGLEDMGRIIAADMFNGNNDRFYFGEPSNLASGIEWGANKKQLIYLINPGNFMVREDGDQAELVGMDAYCNNSVIELSKEVPNNWIYSIFHPDTRVESVKTVAKRCAHDLKTVTANSIGLNRLGRHAARRVAAGMIEGADAIEQYFKLKFGHQGAKVPNGLPSRARLAGWSWLDGVTMQQAFGGLPRRHRNY